MNIQESLVHEIVTGLEEDPNMLLSEWAEVAESLKNLKKKELEMRNKLVDHFFPKPVEGTNTFDLGNAWKLKDKHKINRSCDEASFDSVFEKLPEGFKDSLIKFKPSVNLKEYRRLSDAHRNIFDECLIIKPGTPELALVPPKEKK